MAQKNRRIVQYDTSGNIIEIYPNAKVASMETGVGTSSISRCCNGTRKISGGFVFAFEGNQPSFDGVKTPICRYDLFGNKTEEFQNLQEIESKHPGTTLQAIRLCLRDEKLYYLDSFWAHKGNEDEIPEKVKAYGRQIVAKSMNVDASEDKYYGNLQLASEETDIARVLIKRAIENHGLCHDYAWFYCNDEHLLKKFENFELEYYEFSKKRPIRVTYPSGMEKEFRTIRSAATHIDMPSHLVYCLAHGKHLDKSQGYTVEFIEEEK